MNFGVILRVDLHLLRIWRKFGLEENSRTYLRLLLLPTWRFVCNQCMHNQSVGSCLINLIIYTLICWQLVISSTSWWTKLCSSICYFSQGASFLFVKLRRILLLSFTGHMVSAAPLSRRLGGLYCLYCLYETQPFKPSYKIYLSIGMICRSY